MSNVSIAQPAGNAEPPASARPAPRWRRLRRLLRRLVVVVLLLVVLWFLGCGVAVWLLTHRLGHVAAEPSVAKTGLPLETLRIHTRDGQTLGAWLMRGKPGAPAALLLHGLH